MERREFLASSLGAILTIGLPAPEPSEWKVFRFPSGDFIAARNVTEARAFYVEFTGELAPLDEICEHAIERFGGARFCDEDEWSSVQRGGELIVPWIRRMLAEGPPQPCYLFTDGDCL